VPVASDQVEDSEAALVADDGLTVDRARARATCAPALYIRQPVICVMRTADDCQTAATLMDTKRQRTTERREQSRSTRPGSPISGDFPGRGRAAKNKLKQSSGSSMKGGAHQRE
jgi:hypothetical protein